MSKSFDTDLGGLHRHRSESGELTRGQEVSLIGYQHTRQQPTRERHTKTVTEIYAVALTRRPQHRALLG